MLFQNITQVSPRYRSDLQGLRGTAVALVIAYHVRGYAPGGFVGVDMFFVLSGFVITQSLLAEISHTGTVNIWAFVARRIRRLFPALAVMLTSTMLLSLLFLSPMGTGQIAMRTGRAAAASWANFQLYGSVDYFAPDAETNPFLHTWSLAIEEQFYVVFPLLMSATLALRSGRKIAWTLLYSTVGLLSFALSVALLNTPALLGVDDAVRYAFFSPAGRAFEFLSGALLAAWIIDRPPIPMRFQLAAGPLGLAAIAFASVRFNELTLFPGWTALIPVAGTMLLILGGTSSGPISRLVNSRPLVHLGDISYGAYLWHWPFIVFAESVHRNAVFVAIPLSIALAEVSFRRIEQPIKAQQSLKGSRTIALLAVCVAVPIAVSFVGQYALDEGLGIDGVQVTQQRTAAREIGCHGDLDDPILPIGDCTWSAVNTTGLILLVGDSHAVSIADVVIEAGNQAGYDVAVQTRSLCPFQTRRIKRRGCANYQRQTLALVQTLQPEIVIIANRSPSYTLTPNGDSPYTVVNNDDSIATSQSDALIAWEDGMTRIIDQIDAARTRIIIVETVPEFPGATGTNTISIFRPKGDPLDLDLQTVAARRAPTAAIHKRLTSRPNVSVFDPVPILCDQTCSQYSDGMWIFYDDDHLSVAGSLLLKPGLFDHIIDYP
jgi:peptidoglycan/LPS O-acetylase OafA/YrhL